MTHLKMIKSNVLYHAQESIFARHIQSKELIEYSIEINILESGKQPVRIEMTFIPPHPFVMNMPEKHSIKAENLATAFTKIAKLFKKDGFELY